MTDRTTGKDRFLSCPLCGFEFAPADTLCQHGCPLRSACGLVRCPMCDYEFPETPRAVSWLKGSLAGLLRKLRGGRPRTSGAPRPAEPELLTVRELASGERVEVVHLGEESPDRSNALAVFGLAPGAEIELIQRYPSVVVQVGETLLALDAEVAGTIVVRRPGAETWPAHN